MRTNGEAYRGIIVLILWGEAAARGYVTPILLTLREANSLGGRVRKGEHGTQVVYASTLTRTDVDADTGEESARAIPSLKSHTVFNAEQVDGLSARFQVRPAAPLNPVLRVAHADAFVNATGAQIWHSGVSPVTGCSTISGSWLRRANWFDAKRAEHQDERIELRAHQTFRCFN